MEEQGGQRWPLVVLAACPLQGHMTPILQLATALHAKGFTIAIVHSKLNPPDPFNHPSDFRFFPLPDNISNVDDSGSFKNFTKSLNSNNNKISFREQLIRLMNEGNINRRIVVIYDHLMFFAGDVALDLNLVSILFQGGSAAFFPACIARQQIRQHSRFLEQDYVMQEIVPNYDPLRYKDLPHSNLPIEDWRQMSAFFAQVPHPSAIIWNTINFLEHKALTQIREHYKVPVFAVGPLHKMTPSPNTSFLKEDTSCISWLDKQEPKSVIYISFGSLVTLDANVLTEMAWGLANSKQMFLWVVRPGSVRGYEWLEFLPEGFIEETRDRGLIVKWAPQKDVLAHFAVGGFWTHCGWNSTLESISEGVSMICQPSIADQAVNTRYVSHVWKIGVELECFKRVEIERMIKKVMVDEEGKEMKVRINEMKEMVKESIKSSGSSYDSFESLVSFIGHVNIEENGKATG